ncbi:MAG: hypothetical protein PHO67_08085 [Candidatus Omnitrophica bacterium]|nr:hypothetical protein [Candidatus Omnitrophota bacterium]
MNVSISDMQAPETAGTGDEIRPYCTVHLADGAPAVGFGLGWYDDVQGSQIEYDGITILSPNHEDEVLRPEGRPMPNTQSATFKVAIFLPIYSDELGYSDQEIAELEAAGILWIRTDVTQSFTVKNTDFQDIPDDGDENGGEEEVDGSFWKKWWIPVTAGLAVAASAIGIGVYLKRRS